MGVCTLTLHPWQPWQYARPDTEGVILLVEASAVSLQDNTLFLLC